MTQQQKNTAALFAVIAGLTSIPLTWMTIYGGRFIAGQGSQISIPIEKMYVTGVNGSITVLFQTPIWFIVGIAIAANMLQLIHSYRQFAVPRFAEWLAALFGVVWIGAGISLTLFSDKITLGIGSLLGLFCAGVALLCLVVPTSTQQDLLSR